MAEDQKAELEVQIAQLSEMSGDSSQQMAYLNDQLREKDRLVEELQGQKGSLTGQLERINQDMKSKEEKLVSVSVWTGFKVLAHEKYVYSIAYNSISV